MNFSGAERGRQIVTASVGTLLLVVMGGVLIAGFRLATQMTTNIGALQTASALAAYPNMLSQQLNSLRDRLEARAYAGQALADLKATADRFNHDVSQLVAGDFGRSAELDAAMLEWHQYGPVLNPVTSFAAQPYVDSDESGSSFSKSGLAFYGDVKRAQLFARENSRRLQTQLAEVATHLQQAASQQADRLRWLLSIGVLASLMLAALAAYLQWSRGRSESAARDAQEQTRDILKTVKEGFFLLDADYRVGAVWSQALTRMFGRQDFAGLTFEELLVDRVPPATLTTATKYIKLLWGDRAHENLIKSINPLAQLEIHVDNGHGSRDTHYLQFDFHRVLGRQGAVKHVLVSVTEITSSVLLARELAESQQSANQQVDLMLGVIHLDPAQLISFLDSTDAGLARFNAILEEPARSDPEFRKKLDGLLRELHAIKGEASAVNLMSAAQRVHALEDMVRELNPKPELSGNDFLAILLKLDELMAHLRSVRELATRLTSLNAAVPAAMGGPAPGSHRRAAGEELTKTLTALAERLCTEQRKQFTLSIKGLEEVPTLYRNTVKDVLIQMLRNAAVHGIEPGTVRQSLSKNSTGLVRVVFRRDGEGYELVFEDDGAGLVPEQLKAAAVRKHLITADEAAVMDTRAAITLIFKPGFSTLDTASMDGGRGVGMDVVVRSIYGLGGKIGVNTNPGRFTRFKIALPPVDEAKAAVA